MNQVERLENLVIKSLAAVEDEELRKKLAQNVIVCGGGAQIGEVEDFTQILEE